MRIFLGRSKEVPLIVIFYLFVVVCCGTVWTAKCHHAVQPNYQLSKTPRTGWASSTEIWGTNPNQRWSLESTRDKNPTASTAPFISVGIKELLGLSQPRALGLSWVWALPRWERRGEGQEQPWRSLEGEAKQWRALGSLAVILLPSELEKRDHKRAFPSVVPTNQLDTAEHEHGLILNPGFSSSLLHILMCVLNSTPNTPNSMSVAQVREASTHINVHYAFIRECRHLGGTTSFVCLWVDLAWKTYLSLYTILRKSHFLWDAWTLSKTI